MHFSFPKNAAELSSGCIAIIVNGCKIQTGKYPRVNYEGESWFASRLSYNLNVEKIPTHPPTNKECLVLHTCDNGWCINPNHIYLGTSSQNRKDLWDRNAKFSKERSKQLRKQNNRIFKGKHLSNLTKKKISIALIGNKNRKGGTS